MPRGGPAGAVIVTLTAADWLFFTVTVDVLNDTVAEAMNVRGALIVPFVASAGSCSNVYVTAFPVPGRLVTVSVRVAGPAWLSPRESLPGVISAFASIAARMSSIPAP